MYSTNEARSNSPSRRNDRHSIITVGAGSPDQMPLRPECGSVRWSITPAGQTYWGLRGADDFLTGMTTRSVTLIAGFKKLRPDIRLRTTTPVRVSTRPSTGSSRWRYADTAVLGLPNLSQRTHRTRRRRSPLGTTRADVGKYTAPTSPTYSPFTYPCRTASRSTRITGNELMAATEPSTAFPSRDTCIRTTPTGRRTVYPELPIVRHPQGWVSGCTSTLTGSGAAAASAGARRRRVRSRIPRHRRCHHRARRHNGDSGVRRCREADQAGRQHRFGMPHTFTFDTSGSSHPLLQGVSPPARRPRFRRAAGAGSNIAGCAARPRNPRQRRWRPSTSRAGGDPGRTAEVPSPGGQPRQATHRDHLIWRGFSLRFCRKGW